MASNVSGLIYWHMDKKPLLMFLVYRKHINQNINQFFIRNSFESKRRPNAISFALYHFYENRMPLPVSVSKSECLNR